MDTEQTHIAAIDAVSLLAAVVNARAAYDSTPWTIEEGEPEVSADLARDCWDAVDAAADAGIPDAIIEDAAIVLSEISGVWGLAA